jgi:hypothetical protein
MVTTALLTGTAHIALIIIDGATYHILSAAILRRNRMMRTRPFNRPRHRCPSGSQKSQGAYQKQYGFHYWNITL